MFVFFSTVSRRVAGLENSFTNLNIPAAQATQQQDKINRFLVYKSNDDGHGIRLNNDNKNNSNNIEKNNDICNKPLLNRRGKKRKNYDEDGLGMTITAKSKKTKWRG